jgi:glycosyltransferase involved in cell wall biosynthesis
MEKGTKFDLVLTCFNDEKNLSRCLPSVVIQKNVKRLIVVDAGSTDKTLEVLESFGKDFPIKIIVKEGCTRGEGRNIAIREAKTDFIGCINSDVILYPDWSERILEVMTRDNRIGAVGSNQVLSPDFNLMQKLIYYIPGMNGRLEEFKDDIIWNAHTAPCEALLWRRKAVYDAGLFPSANWGEDSLLHAAMKRKGWKVVLARDAKIIHIYKSSLGKFLKQQYMYGVGGKYIQKNFPDLSKDILRPKSDIIRSVFTSSIDAARREGSAYFFLMIFVQSLKYASNLMGILAG